MGLKYFFLWLYRAMIRHARAAGFNTLQQPPRVKRFDVLLGSLSLYITTCTANIGSHMFHTVGDFFVWLESINKDPHTFQGYRFSLLSLLLL
jgi:hypothetical protein